MPSALVSMIILLLLLDVSRARCARKRAPLLSHPRSTFACMTCGKHELKREKARELRWLGFSTPQIAKMLAVKSPRTISDWTEDIPNPEWTKRPRAKDDLRVVARRMRLEG